LLAQGRTIGLLHLCPSDGTDGRCDPEGMLSTLMPISEHIALALNNLALNDALREQAIRDGLTGLYNRHYLEERLVQEVNRAGRQHVLLAVIMLDIDHFKRINDTYGHAAGDHVLRELGALIRRLVRPSDIPCRYGGEEFVLFLPEMSRGIAEARAEALRVAVQSLKLEVEGRTLGEITVSAGLAMFPDHGEEPTTLLRAADEALYRAKELGRNRVVVATSST
jgi:diguanylate cyclase (GGDEF)-like protein